MSNKNKKEVVGASLDNISSSTDKKLSNSTDPTIQEATDKQTDTKIKPQYVTKDDLFSIAEKEGLLVALANQQQVKKSKNPTKHKTPAISWEKAPKNYKGLEDQRNGTAIRCDYIQELKAYLVVIDLDEPDHKKEERGIQQVPLEVLKSVCLPITKKTYSVETPSGGVHIYGLSREKPKQSQPPINVDYQTNTGTGRGKYVVANYRWNQTGEHKEFYKKLPHSVEKIAYFNSDGLLEDILQKLVDGGHITTPKQERWGNIADIFRRYYKDRGTPNNYRNAIAGYLRKQGYDQSSTEKIMAEVLKGTGDQEQGKQNVKQTFERPLKSIEGYQHLKNVLGKEDLNRLSELTKSSDGDIKSKIIQILAKNKEASVKLIADHVNNCLELYKNLETHKYYERTIAGRFQEINECRIIEFCNDEFGVNNVSTDRCEKVLKHITNPVKKNYDLLEFQNGMLNTKTEEFTSDKSTFDETPKIALDLNWNPDAEPGEIGEIIDTILTNEKHPNDKERWFRAVGHAFMGYNRIGKLTMVQGRSGTGKSTLTTILKRIFDYSEIPTTVINKNERFTLHPLVDKDINIDDDINNGVLKAIGTLNTITTGNGLEVEIKGKNRSIKAENHQIPRLFANGNTLPPVLGEGFERRLLLIHADNFIDYDDKDDYLQGDIISGKYDNKGLEWLVHTAITLYWQNKDKPITTQEDEARMKEDYEFKSYPMLKGIEAVFRDDYSGIQNIPVREVNRWVKAWHIWAYENNKISREHRKPSIKSISSAMDRAGFSKRAFRYEDVVINQYEDIILNEGFKTRLQEYYDLMKGKEKKGQEKLE